MSRFVTIQNNNELNKIASDLQDLYGHTYAEDIKLLNTFGTQKEREKKWGDLQCLLEKKFPDIILISQFVEQDMLTSAYFLAPIRGFRGGRINIKIALILNPNQSFVLPVFTQQVNLLNIPNLDSRDCLELQRIVNDRISQKSSGDVIFVEDKQLRRKFLTDNMTRDKFRDKKIQVMDFDEVHGYISQHLIEQTLPAAIVTDTIEQLGGGVYRCFTGLGLCIMLLSSPRFKDIPCILYSTKFFGDPNDPNPPQKLKAFDEVFIRDKDIANRLNVFFRDV